MSRPLPGRDLDEVLARGEVDVRGWAGSRLLITGGTGFVGRWLVTSLLRAEDRWNLGMRLTLVTRNPARVPRHPAVSVVTSDVRQLQGRLDAHGRFDAVIAGAAASAAPPGSPDADPAGIAATIVADAQHAIRAAAGGRLLLLSSGAVYGRGPTGPVAEHHAFAPDPTDPSTAYGQAKRLAETLSAVATAAGETEAVSARIFTLLGPGLPLDAHFAAGNVLRDVLAQQPIVLRGDGTAARSYLYAGDLVVWLWRLLAAGRPGQAYNVGSPEPVTIRGLAEQAAGLADPPVPVIVEGRPGLASCYLPDVRRASDQLGLEAWTSLPEALACTLAWSRCG